MAREFFVHPRPLTGKGKRKGRKDRRNTRPLKRTVLINMTGAPSGGFDSGGTGKRVLTLEEKRQTAWDLRIQGYSHKQIAQALDVSSNWVNTELRQLLMEITEHTRHTAEEWRTFELARLDDIVLKLWPDRAFHKTTEALMKVLTQRHKLLGLETVHHTHSGVDGGPIPLVTMSNIDLTKLNEQELDWLEVIVAKAGPVGALTPADQRRALPALTAECHEVKQQ